MAFHSKFYFNIKTIFNVEKLFGNLKFFIKLRRNFKVLTFKYPNITNR